MRKILVSLALLAMVATVAWSASEIRLLGKEDLNFATGGTGAAETTTSTGGVTTTDIDATHIFLRRSGSAVSLESATTTAAEITGGTIEKVTIDNSTIGGTTPAVGYFTSVIASEGNIAFLSSGSIQNDFAVSDDVPFSFGTNSDWKVTRDSLTGRLMFSSNETGSTMADGDGMVTWAFNAGNSTLDEGQVIWEVLDYQTPLLQIDKSGNHVISGDYSGTGFLSSASDGYHQYNIANSTGFLGTSEEGTTYYSKSANMQYVYDGTDWMNFGVRVSVPAAATSTCTPGQFAASTTYFYICVDTNTWRRVGVESW